MSRKKAKVDGSGKFDRDAEGFIADYIKTYGHKPFTLADVAAHAVRGGKYKQGTEGAIRELTRRLRRIAGKAGFTDPETGEWIGKYHAYRLGADQPMLWAPIEEISLEGMKDSTTMRRDNIVARFARLDADVTYYNTHFNPGDPIFVDPDLTASLLDRKHSELYDDNPPEDSESTI